MKLIKTKPRYKCDFCRHTAGLVGMTTHEKICWKNPNRYCDYCKNKGRTYESYGEGLGQYIDCPFCSKKQNKLVE